MPSTSIIRILGIRILGALAASAVLWAAAPASAHAEGCGEEASTSTDKTKKNFHVEIKNGQKVYVIDKEITVCGKVPRPAVVYILQPRTINYEWESLKQDFLPQVLESVRKDPF
jgi:hypothetical protein